MKLADIIRQRFPGLDVQEAATEDLAAGGELPKCGAIALTLVDPHNLTRKCCRIAATAFKRAVDQRSEAVIILHANGYDDDPRELWEVPELCAWVATWCRRVGLTSPASVAAATGVLTGNEWVLLCMAAHEGRLTKRADGKYEIRG